MRDLTDMLEDAGFVDVKSVAATGFNSSRYTMGSTFRAWTADNMQNTTFSIPADSGE